MFDSATQTVLDNSALFNGLREADIRSEMGRILRSRAFVHSHRIRRFLQFIVDECLLGQQHRLKEYLIGVEVFNRQEAFDPRVDSIVRVEARRLRTKIEEYYLTEGREDEIRIVLRKGSYVPVFETRQVGISGFAGLTGLPLTSRRCIRLGTVTVFNGGASHDAAVQEVKRRAAHTLIKDGNFQVVLGDEGNADEMKPDYLVEGSMHFREDRVNIILQLLSTADSSYVWSEQVSCTNDDLSPVEDLARSLNRMLITSLSTEAVRGRRSGSNPHSYDMYLQGRYNWKIGTPEGIRNSVPLFTKAIELDPGYAAAWAALSQALMISSVFGYMNSYDTAERMKEAALKAISLNGELPEAHVALGAVLSILDWDWSAGERELQKAVQLAPAVPASHVAYGIQLACRRIPEAAQAELECALELDPASSFTNFCLGWLQTIRGRYDEAIAQHRVVAQFAPDFPLSYLGLGWAHMAKEQFQDAAAYFTNAANLLKSRALVSGSLGYCYARSGNKDEAMRQLMLADGDVDSGSRQISWPVSAAAIYAGLGGRDKALTYLEGAAAAHNTSLPVRTLNPEFNTLRREPRFVEVLRKISIA